MMTLTLSQRPLLSQHFSSLSPTLTPSSSSTDYFLTGRNQVSLSFLFTVDYNWSLRCD
jgi:hypothetical protein